MTESQWAAVRRMGQDVCVVAGPGSGKTRVLVERFAWLVAEGHASPSRLLAITFTEKAAREIQMRLARRFAAQPDLRDEVARAPISTLHGLCARLLREHALAAEIAPDFQVLPEREASLLLAQSVEATLNDLHQRDRERLRRLYRHWKVTDPAHALADAYRAVRLSGEPLAEIPSPPDTARAMASLRQICATYKPRGPKQKQMHDETLEWLANPAGVSICQQRSTSGPLAEAVQQVRSVLATAAFGDERRTLRELLEAIDRRYLAAKRQTAALDFDDLEQFTITMLERDPKLAAQIRDRFDYILMDELQDTNPLQWRLMNLLRRPARFFAVGDRNQAIYGFRHASPTAFRAFREEVAQQGEVDRLAENFRTRESILAFLQATLEDVPGIETPGLIAAGTFDPETEPSVEVLAVKGQDSEDRTEWEARAVARRIQEITASGRFTYRDIALLFRTTSQLAEFEKVLAAFGIPHRVTGGKSFFERQEVADCLHWLRTVSNPLDEISLAAVLRSPFAAVSDTDLGLGRPALGPLIEGVTHTGFLQLLRRQREEAEHIAPALLLTRALDESGYQAALDEAGRASTTKLISLIGGHNSSLADTISYLERCRRAQEEPNAPALDAANAVELLTMHAAKGLEYPVVFLCSLNLEPASDRFALTYSAATGLGATWRDEYGGSIRDLAAEEFRESQKTGDLEEGHRLLYVAMTRAKEKLICSYADTRRGWTKYFSERVTRLVDGPDFPLSNPSAVAPSEAALLFVDPPPVTGQWDAAVSATSLTLFAKCPRRYWLDRYLGWPASAPAAREDVDADSDAERASDLGRDVHRLLAGEAVPDASPEALRLIQVFRSSALGVRAAGARTTEREFDFAFTAEGRVITGQIDLWFEDAAGVTVVDYKTDAVAPEALPTRAAEYRTQMSIYGEALRSITGRQPSLLLHFLRADKVIEVEPQTAWRSTLQALADAQEKQDFPLREAEHCRQCPHWRQSCPSTVGQGQLVLF